MWARAITIVTAIVTVIGVLAGLVTIMDSDTVKRVNSAEELRVSGLDQLIEAREFSESNQHEQARKSYIVAHEQLYAASEKGDVPSKYKLSQLYVDSEFLEYMKYDPVKSGELSLSYWCQTLALGLEITKIYPIYEEGAC